MEETGQRPTGAGSVHDLASCLTTTRGRRISGPLAGGVDQIDEFGLYGLGVAFIVTKRISSDGGERPN